MQFVDQNNGLTQIASLVEEINKSEENLEKGSSFNVKYATS